MRKVAIRLAVLLVAVLTVVAALDGWRLVGNIGSLEAVLQQGNQATPAMKGELDSELQRLGLASKVQKRWSRIVGETDEYTIGAEIKQTIAWVPVRYTAQRQGSFALEQRLPTLEYFVTGGWSLDSVASSRLQEYKESRTRRAVQPPRPAPPPEPSPDEVTDPEGESLGDDPVD